MNQTNQGLKEKSKCSCCGAKTNSAFKLGMVFCSPECSRMFRTGESMDDLVREASRMPDDIPKNNRDYDDFDTEKMMARSDDEYRY